MVFLLSADLNITVHGYAPKGERNTRNFGRNRGWERGVWKNRVGFGLQ